MKWSADGLAFGQIGAQRFARALNDGVEGIMIAFDYSTGLDAQHRGGSFYRAHVAN